MGITHHAQEALGDITFIELPKVGKTVSQFDGIATVESVKAASDIYSPVSGKIMSVNEGLSDAPEKINKSPYDNGWICKISVSDNNGVKNLMDAASYETYLKTL